MKAEKPSALLLAMCLGCSAPLALADADLNDQRAPGTQPHSNEHMNGQDGATGSGTPADGMGTGNGGAHDNGTDNTGGDGTDTDSGSGGNGGMVAVQVWRVAAVAQLGVDQVKDQAARWNGQTAVDLPFMARSFNFAIVQATH